MRNLARAGVGLPEIGQLTAPLQDGYAVDRLVRSFFSYRAEYREVLRTVPRMIADLFNLGYVEGDCDDVSIFCACLLSRMGIRNHFVAIRYGGSEEFLHVFNEWWFNRAQQWVRMDITIPFGTIHQEDERLVIDVL